MKAREADLPSAQADGGKAVPFGERDPKWGVRTSTGDLYRDTVKRVKRDQGDSEEDDRPPICPACGVTMGIREDRTSTRFVCLECGFSDEAGSGR